MSQSTPTTPAIVALTEQVKAYRALGTKVRSLAKRSPLGKAIKAALVAQDDIVKALNAAELQDLAGALVDEQTGLRRLRFTETHEFGHDVHTSKLMIRTARQRVAEALTDAEVEDARIRLDALRAEVFDPATATEVELVTAHRAASAVLFDDAASVTGQREARERMSAIATELGVRELGRVATALTAERGALVSIERSERLDHFVPAYLTEELKAARLVINRVVGEDATHLVGQVVSMFSADSAHDHLGTLTGVIESVEPARDEDNHVVAVYTTGLRVNVPRSLVAITA